MAMIEQADSDDDVPTLDFEVIAMAETPAIRMTILQACLVEPHSPKMLAEMLDARIGTVAYHVRRLHQSGLLDLAHTAQRRGATEHFYCTLAKKTTSCE